MGFHADESDLFLGELGASSVTGRRREPLAFRVSDHLGNFGANFAERFTAILTPVELNVYGPVEGAVREGLAGFGATFYDQVGGFGD